MAKLNVQHHYSSHRSNMLIWCSQNISYYFQCWKPCENHDTFVSVFLDDYKFS